MRKTPSPPRTPPHPSQKGFAKHSWNCLASGLSRTQYIVSRRFCSAGEGSISFLVGPSFFFSHSSFVLFLALFPLFIQTTFLSHFLIFSLPPSFLFSLFSLSPPTLPFSFCPSFLSPSRFAFPLFFLPFLSFCWSDQYVKSYILYCNWLLPPPDSRGSCNECT